MPPDYAMIELNGQLLPPVEFPTADECRTVLGGGNADDADDATGAVVELGQLQLDGDNQVLRLSGDNAVVGQSKSFSMFVLFFCRRALSSLVLPAIHLASLLFSYLSLTRHTCNRHRS